jgi:hypothetical protein
VISRLGCSMLYLYCIINIVTIHNTYIRKHTHTPHTHTHTQHTHTHKGVSKNFRTESITKYTLTTINTRWEATQRIMVAKLTRLTHEIAIQLHLVAESYTTCSSRSRWPVRKLLDTPSYIPNVNTYIYTYTRARARAFNLGYYLMKTESY